MHGWHKLRKAGRKEPKAGRLTTRRRREKRIKKVRNENKLTHIGVVFYYTCIARVTVASDKQVFCI